MFKSKVLTSEDFTRYPNPVVKKSVSVRKQTYEANRVQAIHSVCVLEGIACTEEDVANLLNGGTTSNYMLAGYVDSTDRAIDYVLGHTVGTATRVSEVAPGTYLLGASEVASTLSRFEECYDYPYGRYLVSKSDEDVLKDLNYLLSSYDTFANGYFRGSHPNTSSPGTVNLGNNEYYQGIAESRVKRLALNPFKDLGTRSKFSQALNYAAARPYYQVFFDGNKRTSLFKANIELIDSGYNAIIIPPTRLGDYNTTLREMFTTGKISAYSDFLRSCYIDN